ncbi:hypothetical protein U27_04569 [Candidatus Vecturithrix granuli]|uniref:Uncharacterized protein n=1 Tax=Vecturithrix granuli TaxID=1499967 RepID=A0A081BZ47_VECG1|nr:hypothetical protein U27_04569 [Candidatus Vecturithrix granuli]
MNIDKASTNYVESNLLQLYESTPPFNSMNHARSTSFTHGLFAMQLYVLAIFSEKPYFIVGNNISKLIHVRAICQGEFHIEMLTP